VVAGRWREGMTLVSCEYMMLDSEKAMRVSIQPRIKAVLNNAIRCTHPNAGLLGCLENLAIDKCPMWRELIYEGYYLRKRH
jgi:hypothetical protein